jgi:hypothetical protein
VGQGFGPAAELPLGAELYVSAGSTGDLVAGTPTDRVFDRANSTVSAKIPWSVRLSSRTNQHDAGIGACRAFVAPGREEATEICA